MIESKAAFARRQNVSRSTVTRWGQDGRLVLTETGKVRVEESQAKIKATEGHRGDLREKHAKKRGKEIESPYGHHVVDDSADLNISESDIGKSRAAVKADKLHYENKLIRLHEAIQNGDAIELDEFLKHVSQLANGIKSGLERVIDNLAPQLAGKTEPMERLELIKSGLKTVKPRFNYESDI